MRNSLKKYVRFKSVFTVFIFMISIVTLCFPSYYEAAESNIGVGDFSGLKISEDVVNDPKDMKVSVTSNVKYDVYRVNKGAPITDYGVRDEYINNIYKKYVPDSGKVYIDFPQVYDPSELDSTVIEVEYPEVGFMLSKDFETVDIGARLTISNLKRSPGVLYAGIDLSSNLFSGMHLNNVSSADWSFEFFESQSGNLIDFSNLDVGYDVSNLSFNSLNGYSNEGVHRGDNAEFAREINDKEGTLAKGTMVERSSVRTAKVNNLEYVFPNVYHGTNNDFIDELGGSNFHIASVQFPLDGDRNTYQIGTAYYKNRGWFAFSSSKINAPYRHWNPTKTVQPLNQYQRNDQPNHPTGSESGFDQRYFNDLDVYQTTSGQSELPNYYRVQGHDVDKPKELVSGVPKREERFIERNQEFYYFINQKTIHLGTDGIILPTGYQISDELPSGVVLTEHPFTLYNLDGSEIDLEDVAVNDYDGDSSFSLKLSDKQTKKINDLAKLFEYYGEDFSLRVRVRATEDIKPGELVVNQASTTFTYFGSKDPDDSKTQKSNHVGVRLEGAKIEFDKVNQLDHPLESAEFKIYEYDPDKKDHKGRLLDTKESGLDGKVVFDYNFFPGKYVLEESKAPSDYIPHDDVVIEVDDNLNVIWPKEINGKIVNEKGYNLRLKKVNEDGQPLESAKFILSGGDLDEEIESESNEDGELEFLGGPMFKGHTYTLTEVEAPEGYDKLEAPYQIEIAEDGLSAYLIDDKGKKTELDVELLDGGFIHNEITGKDGFVIKNSRSKTTLEVIKQDKDSKKVIKDVSFKVFKEGDDPSKAKEYTTDKDGKFTVSELDVRETYYIKEVEAPNDYILLDQDIKLSFDKAQNTWIVTEKDTGEELENIVWNSESSKLSVIIFNEQKKVLPQTGGSGIVIPLVISSLAGLGSLSYFIRFKRNEV